MKTKKKINRRRIWREEEEAGEKRIVGGGKGTLGKKFKCNVFTLNFCGMSP